MPDVERPQSTPPEQEKPKSPERGSPEQTAAGKSRTEAAQVSSPDLQKIIALMGPGARTIQAFINAFRKTGDNQSNGDQTRAADNGGNGNNGNNGDAQGENLAHGDKGNRNNNGARADSGANRNNNGVDKSEQDVLGATTDQARTTTPSDRMVTLSDLAVLATIGLQTTGRPGDEQMQNPDRNSILI